MSSAAAVGVERAGSAVAWGRRAPWTGIAFIVFFIGGIVVSSPPSDTASDATWVADYSTHGKQLGHIATGVSLVLAGLCLLVFITHIWARVAAARQPQRISPVPVVAAAVTAACMSVGGVLMAASAGMVNGGAPMPSADFLRFGNDVGFIMVAVPGMLATALCIGCIGVQARSAGVFGKRLLWLSLVVAVLLIPSLLFFPMLALLIWVLVVAVALLRDAPVRA